MFVVVNLDRLVQFTNAVFDSCLILFCVVNLQYYKHKSVL